MKKIIGLILTLVCLLNFTTSVNAASSTITAYKSSTQFEYVSGLPIYYNRTGSYNLYVLNNDTYYETNTVLRDPEVVNGGFQYIINNSNPTNNSNKNYYITQVAILWYEDYLNGNDDNISSSIKTYIASNTGDTVCYYINKLVNNAKKYGDVEDSIIFEDKNITFTKNGSYYYSNVIDVVTNDLYSNPTVKLYNAPTSATIINNTVTKDGEGSFQIRIPSSSLTSFDEKDFVVYINSTTNNKTVYKYSNYGVDDAIYSLGYNSNNSSVEASLPVTIKGVENTNIRIKLLDEKANYIKNIKYYIYSGNCLNTTCDSDDLVHNFTTTSTYTTLNNILSEGIYTFVRKTNNSNYDLNEKELVEVEDTTSTQTFTFESNEDYDDTAYNNITIKNTINDSSNIIKIYKNNGSLVDSYRANNTNYQIKLYEGTYYITDSEGLLLKIYFKIDENGSLYVKDSNSYVSKSYINLDDYYVRQTTDVEEDNEEDKTTNDNIYTEDGTIHIDNLDGINSIDITQDVETTTDVKIDWISNIIDCPKTSISSTIKYIIGAIVLALGIFLTIKNVKKSKNSI